MTTPDDRRYDPELDDRTIDEPLSDRRIDDPLADRTMEPPLGDPRTEEPLTDHTTEQPVADRTQARTEEPVTAGPAADEPLVAEDSAVDYRARWEVIQQGFVDDPRKAVSEADSLVDDVLRNLSDSFDRQHQGLEQQWSGGEPSTEDLRSALQRYRAFFQRLVAL